MPPLLFIPSQTPLLFLRLLPISHTQQLSEKKKTREEENTHTLALYLQTNRYINIFNLLLNANDLLLANNKICQINKHQPTPVTYTRSLYHHWIDRRISISSTLEYSPSKLYYILSCVREPRLNIEFVLVYQSTNLRLSHLYIYHWGRARSVILYHHYQP